MKILILSVISIVLIQNVEINSRLRTKTETCSAGVVVDEKECRLHDPASIERCCPCVGDNAVSGSNTQCYVSEFRVSLRDSCKHYINQGVKQASITNGRKQQREWDTDGTVHSSVYLWGNIVGTTSAYWDSMKTKLGQVGETAMQNMNAKEKLSFSELEEGVSIGVKPPLVPITADGSFDMRWTTAKSLQNFLALTYCHWTKLDTTVDLGVNFDIKPSNTIGKITTIFPFNAHNTNNQGVAMCAEKYADDGRNVLVIGFRGTQMFSPINWIMNFDARQHMSAQHDDLSETSGVKFHKGVYRELSEVLKTTSKLQQTTPNASGVQKSHINGRGAIDISAVGNMCCEGEGCHVRLIGHSKGGGMAQIQLHSSLNPRFHNFESFKQHIKSIAVYGQESMQVVKSDTTCEYHRDIMEWAKDLNPTMSNFVDDNVTLGHTGGIPIWLSAQDGDLVPDIASYVGYTDVGTRRPIPPHMTNPCHEQFGNKMCFIQNHVTFLGQTIGRAQKDPKCIPRGSAGGDDTGYQSADHFSQQKQTDSNSSLENRISALEAKMMEKEKNKTY